MAIILALKNTMSFVLVTFCCIGSACHAYFLLGVKKVEGMDDLYASFLTVFRLGMLGDFDMFELEGQDTVYAAGEDGTWEPQDPELQRIGIFVHLLFFVVSLVVTVAMLTLLTGILGSNYDSCLEASSANFLREQARLMTAYATHPWVWFSVRSRLEDSSQRFLWAASRPGESEATICELKDLVESRHAMIEETLDRRLKPLEETLDRRLKPLEQKLQSVESMERKLDTLQNFLMNQEHR
jgi:hypothetical protein